MKNIYVLLFLLVLGACNSSEAKKTETITPPKIELDPRKIAEQYKPQNAEIVHDVIQMNLWGLKNAIIVFYETRYQENDEYKHNRQYVEGYILIPTQRGLYKKIFIDKFQDDNVDTVVESVFFANADIDKEKELVILSTATHRLQYLYEGTEYYASIYDDVANINHSKLKPIHLEINAGFEGYLEDENKREYHKAKLKTADDVRKELKNLGF